MLQKEINKYSCINSKILMLIYSDSLFLNMGFIFPLFLIAGLTLLIPVLIHLFNLRKYKRVFFPDIRFLRSIQLSTKRQAKIKNWWLLISRLLFLLALVLAFAQPFWGSNHKNKASVSVLHIDNSFSMSVSDGQESLLQQALNKAKGFIEQSGIDGRFIVLTNEKMAASRLLNKQEALEQLNNVATTAKAVSLSQIANSIAAAKQNEADESWNVYVFSDFQSSNLDSAEKATIKFPSGTQLYFYPFQALNATNIFVDTAFFLSPTLDPKQANPLVVRVKQSGKLVANENQLKVNVGDQVRAVSSVTLPEGTHTWQDTLALQLKGAGWQNIAIHVQDKNINFDDTFNIAARTAPEMRILLVNDGSLNPYLQTAFKADDAFKVDQQNQNSLQPETWKNYALIILQNLNSLNESVVHAVNDALERGQQILLFPGSNINNIDLYNSALKNWGDIILSSNDATLQQVINIQTSHPLLIDLFEKLPENVQLPTVSQRYPITAGINTNAQQLMSFKDGKPFLVQFNLKKGKLFLASSALEESSSNFAVSYYFMPILYKMALQSSGGNIYAITIGNKQPIWIPQGNTNNERSVWHVSAPGFDAIPPQQPSGVGLNLYLNTLINTPGFYKVYHAANTDTIMLGLNASRLESELEYLKPAIINKMIPQHIEWLSVSKVGNKGWNHQETSIPLWKIAIVIALIALGIETILLIKPKKTTA
jgi:hypothetical protein